MKRWIVAALLLSVIPHTGHAGENQAAQAGRFFINPMVGGLHMESSSYDPEVNYSVAGGYNYNANLSVEILAGFAQEKSGPDSEVYHAGIGALYHFMPEKRLVPYLAVGIGLLAVNEAHDDTDHHSRFDYGVGLKYFLNKDFAVNTEVRHMLASSGEPNNLMYSAGLVYYFGGEARPAPPPTPAPSTVMGMVLLTGWTRAPARRPVLPLTGKAARWTATATVFMTIATSAPPLRPARRLTGRAAHWTVTVTAFMIISTNAPVPARG